MTPDEYEADWQKLLKPLPPASVMCWNCQAVIGESDRRDHQVQDVTALGSMRREIVVTRCPHPARQVPPEVAELERLYRL